MGKAALFVLIAAAAGLLVYLLAAPKFVHPHVPVTPPEQGAAPPPIAPIPSSSGAPGVGPKPPDSNVYNGSNNVDTASRIEAPKTNEERTRLDLETRRGPFYDWIRTNMQKLLVGWEPSKADPATLDLYLARTNSADIDICMNQLVMPYATHYGFNHVRFNVPNPTSDVDRWRVDSEASPDSAGTWRLYRK